MKKLKLLFVALITATVLFIGCEKAFDDDLKATITVKFDQDVYSNYGYYNEDGNFAYIVDEFELASIYEIVDDTIVTIRNNTYVIENKITYIIISGKKYLVEKRYMYQSTSVNYELINRSQFKREIGYFEIVFDLYCAEDTRHRDTIIQVVDMGFSVKNTYNGLFYPETVVKLDGRRVLDVLVSDYHLFKK